MFHVPEPFRERNGLMPSSIHDGNNGVFFLRSLKLKRPLRTIVSDGGGWEHVSVSLADRCPTWDEMCFIKNMFWDEDDLVIQFHPPKSEYVNCHKYCLHLWRKTNTNNFCETPPKLFVGPA